MAEKRGHPSNALTAAKVRKERTPGMYADGNGLYLRVDPSGARRWVQRIVINGKRRKLGLGGWPTVSLAEAREKAVVNLGIVRSGGDPPAEKRRITMPTFAVAAAKVVELNRPTWTSAKHLYKWEMTFQKYANPVIGDILVGDVTRADLMRILTPIWTAKSETARRVRQRIGVVMDWAIAQGFREDNPVDTALKRGLPQVPSVVVHQRAIPHAEVAGAIRRVNGSGAPPATCLSFEFLVLTAVRSGNVRLTVWDEFDQDSKMWTIPAERMKGRLGSRREHRVPLAARALEILDQARELDNGSGLVFPSPLTGRALSDATHREHLKGLGIDATPHGFRSSFRDWCSEVAHAPEEVAEAALAHVRSDKTEAAYARSDLLDRRGVLMEQWAEYLEKG